MSYGSTLQTRLGLDFDITKFGIAIDPFGDLDQRLAKQPSIIRDNTATVYTAVADSVVNTSTYFQNPLTTSLTLLTNIVSTLRAIILDYKVDDIPILEPISPNLDTTCTSLIQELFTNDSNTNGTPKSFNSFISHTDRLSNLKFSNKSSRPDFSGAQSVMRPVQALVYQTETTSTSTVGALGLGAFTSLFINSDLVSYYSSLTSDLSVIGNLLSTNPTTVTPTITAAVTTATSNLEGLLDLVTTRRTHDENFYQAAVSIGQDLNKILANKGLASTSSAASGYLIDNLIGTTALKNL